MGRRLSEMTEREVQAGVEARDAADWEELNREDDVEEKSPCVDCRHRTPNGPEFCRMIGSCPI